MSRKRLDRWASIAILLAITILAGWQAVPAYGQDDGGRKVRTKVAPVYPELAKRMNVGGTVKLQVTIGANGAITQTKVIGGHPLLVDAAQDAIRKWKYEPAGGDTTTVVEFKFQQGQQ